MQDPVLKIRIILSMRMEYLVVLMMLSVMTLALLQNVDEWFTFILKKSTCISRKLFVELKSGIKPIN